MSEGHIDFLERQLDPIGRIGLERRAQAHVAGLGEGGAPGLRGETWRFHATAQAALHFATVLRRLFLDLIHSKL
jgi:hypothetical protein